MPVLSKIFLSSSTSAVSDEPNTFFIYIPPGRETYHVFNILLNIHVFRLVQMANYLG